MTSNGIKRYFNDLYRAGGKKTNRILIYILPKLIHDTAFIFQDGKNVLISIEGDKLIIDGL